VEVRDYHPDQVARSLQAAPPIMGLIFQATHSMALARLVPMVCYTFVTNYAFYGSRTRAPDLNAVGV